MAIDMALSEGARYSMNQQRFAIPTYWVAHHIPYWSIPYWSHAAGNSVGYQAKHCIMHSGALYFLFSTRISRRSGLRSKKYLRDDEKVRRRCHWKKNFSRVMIRRLLIVQFQAKERYLMAMLRWGSPWQWWVAFMWRTCPVKRFASAMLGKPPKVHGKGVSHKRSTKIYGGRLYQSEF